MLFILIGVLGFVLLFLFDVACVKGLPLAKKAFWALGSATILYSVVMVCSRSAAFTFPVYVRVVGWVLALGFFGLLVFSLLIEIPFQATYMSARAGSGLVTTGTYGLVRHPGVLWWALFLVGLFLLSGSKLLAAAIPLWGGVNILYAALQEKLFFVRMFGDSYVAYQRIVPMFIPTRASIARFFATIHRTALR